MQTDRKMLILYSEDYRNRLDEVTSILTDLSLKRNCRLVPAKKFLTNPDGYLEQSPHVICMLHSAELKEVINIALEMDVSLGLLRPPVSRQPQIYDSFDIPQYLEEAVLLAVKDSNERYDMLRCNGELVLGKLTLGQMPFHLHQNIVDETPGLKERGRKLLLSLRQLFDLRPQLITITTAKGRTVTTAASWVCIVENIKPPFYFGKEEFFSTRDRQISVFLLAPSSGVNYLKILLYDFFRITRASLQGLGYIKSQALSIKSDTPIIYAIDGIDYRDDTLDIRLTDGALRINAGQVYVEANRQSTSDKEQVSVSRLPQNVTRLKYLKTSLPFLSHALTEEFKELFITLRESASFTGAYLLLILLSSILATLGLFLNSASVVIGAMVLAPLMAPLISLSMGLLRSEIQLVKQSGITLLFGVASALLISALFSAWLPYDKATDEILARLHPSLLDLFVAIVSGIAGAYATAREHVAKSLSGVAIAVALVPPLCVAGIGIGWFDYAVFSSAFLLFLTNLIGITLAAMVTFLLMGFAPFSLGAKGMGISTALAALISVPLFFSFQDMIESVRIESLLEDKSYIIDQTKVRLKRIRIREEKGLVVSADLLTGELMDSGSIDNLKKQVEQDIGKPVALELSVFVFRE